jgi:hypothetical protein
VAPPVVMVFRAELDGPAAGEDAAPDEELPVAAGVDVEFDELPHATAIRAIPARQAGAHHRLRITCSRS